MGEIFDSPGKKYPRLCLLFLAIVLFGIISWLPHLNDKERGPVAFVWPENQTRSTRNLVRPDQVTLTSDLRSAWIKICLAGDHPAEAIKSVQQWKQHKWIRSVSSHCCLQCRRQLGSQNRGKKMNCLLIMIRTKNVDGHWAGEGELGERPVNAFWSPSRLSPRPPCQQLQTGDFLVWSRLIRLSLQILN